jgi:hypothetical protein
VLFEIGGEFQFEVFDYFQEFSISFERFEWGRNVGAAENFDDFSIIIDNVVRRRSNTQAGEVLSVSRKRFHETVADMWSKPMNIDDLPAKADSRPDADFETHVRHLCDHFPGERPKTVPGGQKCVVDIEEHFRTVGGARLVAG